MSPRGTLPLADAPLLARASRRTMLVRIALTAALAAALAVGGLLVAGGHERAAAAGGPAANTIVVLDLSGSVSGDAYLRVGALLESLAAHRHDGHRVGLVLFSDLAQEALPPGTSPAALSAYVRFFRPIRPKDGTQQSVRALVNPYPDNPWMPSFSRGTVISLGLALARALVVRDHLHSARVLLVSDLFDAASDAVPLRTQLLAYARMPGVELRVMPLPPFSDDTMRLFKAFLDNPHVTIEPREPAPLETEGAASSFPIAFVAIVGALALALAANELLGAPFRWREGRPE